MITHEEGKSNDFQHYLLWSRSRNLYFLPPESSPQLMGRQALTLHLGQYVLFPIAWQPGNQRRQNAHLTPNLRVAPRDFTFSFPPWMVGHWLPCSLHQLCLCFPRYEDISRGKGALPVPTHLVILTDDSYSIPKVVKVWDLCQALLYDKHHWITLLVSKTEILKETIVFNVLSKIQKVAQ